MFYVSVYLHFSVLPKCDGMEILSIVVCNHRGVARISERGFLTIAREARAQNLSATPIF